MNFKRFCYLGTSFIFYLTIITGFTYLCWFCDVGLNPKLSLLPTIFARGMFEIILLAIVLLVLVVVDNKLMKENTYSFCAGIDMFFIRHKTKKVYHSELGEFLAVITNKKISLIKQNYFTVYELAEFNNDNNQVLITNRIKQELDSEYQKQLREVKDKKEDKKSGLNALDNWDGFFDNQTRRDKKIDNLLKQKK